MKRVLILFLLFSFLLSGCGILGERIKEPVSFYYIHANYQEDMANVIHSEDREASGHRDDLFYLLTLYMMGPSDDELMSPLPRGAKITSAVQNGSSITIQLSDITKVISEAEFSLACACLSLTCFDLTDADKVTVQSGEWIVSMSQDSLTLSDSTSLSTEDTK